MSVVFYTVIKCKIKLWINRTLVNKIIETKLFFLADEWNWSDPSLPSAVSI